MRLMRSRLDVLEKEQAKNEERAHKQILDFLKQLRRELQVEKESRVREEEKLAGTMTEFSLILQQGLRIVNKSEF